MNEPVLDLVVFDEISNLMEGALSEFIDTYLENSPKLLKNIDQSLSQGDLSGVFHSAPAEGWQWEYWRYAGVSVSQKNRGIVASWLCRRD